MSDEEYEYDYDSAGDDQNYEYDQDDGCIEEDESIAIGNKSRYYWYINNYAMVV